MVAATVSIGRWNRWIRAAVPFLVGQDILEIGYGPGHLQAHLLASAKLRVSGLDESRQMAVLAKRRLERRGLGPIQLARGRAQALPFSSESFDTVVSTFPSQYIFEPQTLHEVYRILRVGGSFVVVPAASIIGKRLADRSAAWLLRVTHQSPRSLREILTERLERGLWAAGFEPQFLTMEILSSVVFIVNSRKAAAQP